MTGIIHPTSDNSLRTDVALRAAHRLQRPVPSTAAPHTRASSPNAAGTDSATASEDTNTVRSFTRTAGTGNIPSRNHRYAVYR
jgi:hypothetical protein